MTVAVGLGRTPFIMDVGRTQFGMTVAVGVDRTPFRMDVGRTPFGMTDTGSGGGTNTI